MQCLQCSSDDTEMLSSEDGVDVYKCFDCGEYFESDTFVAHPKNPPVKNRRVKFDDQESNDN